MQTCFPNNSVADEQVREQALDARQSFIVQAPAGSGKTGLLTQRFLVLLSVAEVGPEECLAITFTRKAASEMRDRILLALTGAKNPTSPKDTYEYQTWRLARAVLERDKKLGWDILHNPARLKIQTIDAFCAGITRQMPILSRFGAQPSITEDPRLLYQTAAENLLKSVETDDPWSEALRVLLAHLDNNLGLAVRLLADMLSHRDQWLPYIGQTFAISAVEIRTILETGLETVVQESLDALVFSVSSVNFRELWALAELAAFECERLNIDSTILQCRNLQGTSPGTELADLPQWLGLAELLFTQENTLRKTITKQQGFPSPSSATRPEDKQHFKNIKERMNTCLELLAEHPVFLEKLRLLRECPPVTYTADQWQIVSALIQLLPVLAAELALVFQENNTVDFTEMTLAALKALGEPDAPTDLALGLDYKIHHILIDEFQDTSLSQFRLLEKLTAGWQSNDGRTLFLVGDPMQSIYRFRQAEVGLFIRAKQQGIGDITLNSLALTTNFRSEPELVDWANHYFKTQFPSQDDITSGAIAFSASSAFRTTSFDKSVLASVQQVTPEAEPEVVVDLINAVREADSKGSIALLVKSRRHLEKLLPRLREANINYQGVQLEKLIDRPVVQDLLTLTRALLHLGDRIAWLALLRTPWGCVSLADLFLIANFEPVIPIWHALESYLEISGLSAEGRDRLNFLVPVLSNALMQYQRLPLRTWVTQTWIALGGLDNHDDNSLHDAEAYFGLLDIIERDGDFDEVGMLEQKIQSHYATAIQKNINNQNNAVQIMTIHKAKGLEFDTVIVPGMGRRTMSDPSRLLLWEERIGVLADSYLLMAPIKRVGNHLDPIYSYLKQQEDCRAAHEAKRLEYVAATRARKRLYWLTQKEMLF